MTYSLRTLMIAAILGPLVLAMMVIVLTGAFDVINHPVLLTAIGVAGGGVIGRRAGRWKGEIIGAVVGAALAFLTLFGYVAINS